jgi:hypothetical protein
MQPQYSKNGGIDIFPIISLHQANEALTNQSQPSPTQQSCIMQTFTSSHRNPITVEAFWQITTQNNITYR